MQRRRKGGRDMADYSMTDEKWNNKKEIIGVWFEANPDLAQEENREALANGFFGIGDIQPDRRKQYWTSIARLFAGLSNIPPELDFEEETMSYSVTKKCGGSHLWPNCESTNEFVCEDCDAEESCSHEKLGLDHGCAKYDDWQYCTGCFEVYFCEECVDSNQKNHSLGVLECSRCELKFQQAMPNFEVEQEHASIGYREGGLDPYKNDESGPN